MSTVGKDVSGIDMSGGAGRSLAPPHARRDGYAFCPEDGFWFRPSYTEGICPLCGEAVPGGAPALPLLGRMDRSWLGMAVLALESLVMLALVLFLYFNG
jgi:hypothetical protein